ncbi:LPS translocon maturation chaperone LptM [Ferrovum sp. JA12]|uniref:LPS translocon maturation chaperone LptM n=1 Tax=Ferrovum sp. JA12 TaxID=1356299 RepID=UPI00128F308D
MILFSNKNEKILFFNNVIDLFPMKSPNLTKLFFFSMWLTLSLNGCGLRGPLYLPPKSTPKEPPKASVDIKPSQLISH